METRCLPVRSAAVPVWGMGVRFLLAQGLKRLPGRKRYLTFGYDVVRACRVRVAEVPSGGLGTLPLAPLKES